MIRVSGIPSQSREYLIEEAIRLIQQDPENALKTGYLGIKNYAAFGDQREDHSYGMGPRHGSIVFSIGRDQRTPIEPSDVDELIRVRDFGGKEIPERVLDLMYRGHRKGTLWNYQNAVRAQKRLEDALKDVNAQLAIVQSTP
jgi:hypothetical protein